MSRLKTLLAPLRVLDVVHRTGGVTRAAAQLHVTPGAVSHQLRKLESGLGVSLVGKAGRDLEFTDTGRDLARRAAVLFDGLEDALAQASGDGQRRPICVKLIPTLAIQWLMPRLADFYSRHHDIDLEIATVARADDTGLHNADFVVRRGDGQWPDLRADLLFADELVVACTPALARQIQRPADLLQAKLLKSIIAPDAWAHWLAAQGLAPDAATRVIPLANAALCLQAAVQGLGVVVTQRAYMAHALAAGSLVQPVPQVLASGDGYYLVHDPAKTRAAPYRHFVHWILDMARLAPLSPATVSATG